MGYRPAHQAPVRARGRRERLPSASAPATKLEQISCRMRKFCHAGDDIRRLPTVRTYNGLRPSKVQQWTEGRQRRTTQVDTQVDPGGCHRANLYRNLIWQSCSAGTNARNPWDQSGVFRATRCALVRRRAWRRRYRRQPRVRPSVVGPRFRTPYRGLVQYWHAGDGTAPRGRRPTDVLQA